VHDLGVEFVGHLFGPRAEPASDRRAGGGFTSSPPARSLVDAGGAPDPYEHTKMLRNRAFL
jgi:hypothetical protein